MGLGLNRRSRSSLSGTGQGIQVVETAYAEIWRQESAWVVLENPGGLSVGGRERSERLTENWAGAFKDGFLEMGAGDTERTGPLMHLASLVHPSLLRGSGILLQMQLSWSPKVG